jgi:putative ABC transport system ATP-binding protein
MRWVPCSQKLDTRKRSALHKQYVVFVFQPYRLLDELTHADNLDVPLSHRDIKASERQAILTDTLVRLITSGLLRAINSR